MPPNLLALASDQVAAVHLAAARWAREVLDEAGLGALTLEVTLPGMAAPRSGLSLVVYSLSPWPKGGDAASAISLLSGGAADEQSTVPEAWRRLSRALQTGVERSYPPADPGGRARFNPLPALDRLPAPLRDWYLAQPRPEEGESWAVEVQGRLGGRLPSLGWRPAVQMRLSYFLLVAAPEDAPEVLATSLGALGAVHLALARKRAARLHQRPAPCDPALWTYVEALALANEGELAAELRAAAALAQREQDITLSVVPVPPPTGEFLTELSRSLGRPLQPSAHLAVHAALGAGAEFGPGSSASVNTTRPSDPGPPARR